MPVPIELGSLNNLPPLDKIKYTQLDYDTIKQGIVQFIRANYPNIQNDFFESNAGIMIIDLLSWINDTLALRADFLVNEAYLATASTQKAILQMLSYINYYPASASPAVGTVTITLTDGDPGLFTGAALTNDVIISTASAPYEIFITDNSGNPLTYEVFKSSIDRESTVIFPAGSIIGSYITADIHEGKTVLNNIKLPSNVTQNFTITLPDTNIIENENDVTININGVIWRQTTNFAFENGQTNTFELRQINQSQYNVVFGDGIFGAIPPSNGLIDIKYRIGGGAVGNISLGTMNTVQTLTSNQLPVTFKFYNSTAAVGGADQENLEYSKKIAPKNFAAQLRTVTGEDYTVYALGYGNGTSGSIAKALSIIRPYLAAYGRNTGNYDISSSNNKIKLRIDDTYRTITLATGTNLTLQQVCDDFNTKVAAFFTPPTLVNFSAFPYPATIYKITNTKTDAAVTIDNLTRNMVIKYNLDLFTVALTTGIRTYQQICDDINAQTNIGNNTNLYEFRAEVINGHIELIAVRQYDPGTDIFYLDAASNSAYLLLGFTILVAPLASSGNKFATGLNYHNPSAALEVMNIANNAYDTLGLDYSTSGNGLGRALPMAANYVDIYVLANGAGNIITTASTALKSALLNFINRFKVLTDNIGIWDGSIKLIGFNILIVVNPSYNIKTVRNNALAYLNVYTSGALNNFGDSMYISKIYELLEAVNGVDHVEINDITENGISQLTSGNGLIRDIATNWNEVWIRDIITLTAAYKVA